MASTGGLGSTFFTASRSDISAAGQLIAYDGRDPKAERAVGERENSGRVLRAKVVTVTPAPPAARPGEPVMSTKPLSSGSSATMRPGAGPAGREGSSVVNELGV